MNTDMDIDINTVTVKWKSEMMMRLVSCVRILRR